MSGAGTLLGLTTLPQKLLLGGLGLALAAAGAFNVVQAVENRRLVADKAELDTRINDPVTGYVVRLTQATTNTSTCKAAIARQNTAIRTQSEKDAATIAAVQARYDAEHRALVSAEKSAAAFLARKPQGATLTDRVTDVDAQILGDLK